MTRVQSHLTHGRHIPVLDGIRGLAVLLVMFQHFFHGVARGPSAADAVVFGLASRSWMGVDLFFVLSGFLITGILWDAKGRPRYFRDFYARRMLRIFPAYYAVLLVFFVLLPLLDLPAVNAYLRDSLPDQVWHWTYLSNFRIAWRGEWYLHHFPNVFWSLAIEEQFYMVWPLVVLACGRRSLMVTCAVLFSLSLALRNVLAFDPDVNWVARFVLTPTRMDGLVLGALLALLLRSEIDLRASRRWGFAALLLGLLPLAWITMQRSGDWREMPIQSTRFTFVAVFFGALLWLAVTGPPGGVLDRVFGNRGMRTLGKYSYALYLWHGPCVTFARSIHHPDESPLIAGSRLPAQLLHFAFAFGLSLLAAWLSWHVLEKHFLRLRGRFRNE